MNRSFAMNLDLLGRQNIGEVASWRQHLHSIAEFGFEEIQTSRLVADLLESFGVEVVQGVGGTGVVGVIKRGTSDRGIALRADMDALKILEKTGLPYCSQHQGLMHACGHDGHSAILLGAARHLAQSGTFDGTVNFIFQPAEEHGRGARAMIDAGLFERFRIDEVYGLHNLPGMPVGKFTTRPGPINACEDNFVIRIRGKGGHAARPQSSNDPLVIAAHLVLALQAIVSRRVSPLDNAVVSVTEVSSDGTRNVLAENVVIKGDTRSYTPEVRTLIEHEMRTVAQGIGATFAAAVEVEYTHEFAATVNHEAATEYALAAASEALGAGNVEITPAPYMGSEDFGLFLEQRPGNFGYLGNGTEGPSGQPLHSAHYDFNDAAIGPGIAYWTSLVHQRLPG
jgi:hippurate hydrolase